MTAECEASVTDHWPLMGTGVQHVQARLQPQDALPQDGGLREPRTAGGPRRPAQGKHSRRRREVVGPLSGNVRYVFGEWSELSRPALPVVLDDQPCAKASSSSRPAVENVRAMGD